MPILFSFINVWRQKWHQNHNIFLSFFLNSVWFNFMIFSTYKWWMDLPCDFWRDSVWYSFRRLTPFNPWTFLLWILVMKTARVFLVFFIQLLKSQCFLLWLGGVWTCSWHFLLNIRSVCNVEGVKSREKEKLFTKKTLISISWSFGSIFCWLLFTQFSVVSVLNSFLFACNLLLSWKQTL